MSLHESSCKCSACQSNFDQFQRVVAENPAIAARFAGLDGKAEIEREFNILLKNASDYVTPGLRQAFDVMQKSIYPPFNNMGGNLPSTPLFFPHGEILGASVVKQKTKIDWLAFTSSADLEAIKLLLQVIWPDLKFARNGHGTKGYPESCSIKHDGVQFGQLSFGAKHGRSLVSLTGTACKTMTDDMVTILHEALSLEEMGVRLSRVDLCFDLFKGERTIDHAIWQAKQGAFNRGNGGVDPETRLVGTTKGGKNLGRTFYVGKRDGHCMARVYEKGLEVYAKLPEDQRLLSECRDQELQLSAPREGFESWVADDWLRLEVEYKRKGKDLELPFDMLLRRDDYFAGAYPYFADALGSGDGVRPQGTKTDLEVDLVAMIANAKKSYGSLIHSLTELGFTSDQVVEYLSSGRNNDRLVKSGLLMRTKQILREQQESAELLDPDFDIPF